PPATTPTKAVVGSPGAMSQPDGTCNVTGPKVIVFGPLVAGGPGVVAAWVVDVAAAGDVAPGEEAPGDVAAVDEADVEGGPSSASEPAPEHAPRAARAARAAATSAHRRSRRSFTVTS